MKPQFLLFLFILEKTKYLKVGHYLEPSRCKTTSTVTFSLKIQTSTRILFQSIREHNIPNTVYDLQKKRQNPNIQPYKIIPHTSGPLLRALVAGREAAVCVHVQMIFTLLFTKFIFAKLKQFFFFVDGPRSSTTIPVMRSSVSSVRLTTSDCRGVGRKASIYLFIYCI